MYILPHTFDKYYIIAKSIYIPQGDELVVDSASVQFQLSIHNIENLR